MTLQTDTDQRLLAELSVVERHLIETTATLQRPLADLVGAQISQAAPHVHAAFVIAAAWSQNASELSTQRRQWLATALEMLYIALRIHKLLVAHSVRNPDTGDGRPTTRTDRTFVGSTILAGDYCFSKAAQMAAKTESPVVVGVFAQALQTISEGQLRALFSGTFNLHDETQVLLHFGIVAALELAGRSDSDRDKILALGKQLSTYLYNHDPKTRLTAPPAQVVTQAGLPSSQAAAWSSVVHLLAPDTDNGRL